MPYSVMRSEVLLNKVRNLPKNIINILSTYFSEYNLRQLSPIEIWCCLPQSQYWLKVDYSAHLLLGDVMYICWMKARVS